MPRERWYVTRTNPRQEAGAALFLRQLADVETFLPFASKRVLHRNRIVRRREPMFPGYLFTRFALSLVTWSKVKATPGVFNVMKGAGNEFPQFVEDTVVEHIRGECVDDVLPVDDSYSFKPGELIRITHGSYRDFPALFHSSAGERVRALVRLFNRDSEVEVPMNFVARAAS